MASVWRFPSLAVEQSKFDHIDRREKYRTDRTGSVDATPATSSSYVNLSRKHTFNEAGTRTLDTCPMARGFTGRLRRKLLLPSAVTKFVGVAAFI
jgi:hypothetical protein